MTANRALLPTLILVGLAACRPDRAPTALQTPQPRLDIVDAARGAGGRPHFYFLPPIAPSVTYTGAFDPALLPTVRVCALSGNACATPGVAEFTACDRSTRRIRRIVRQCRRAVHVPWTQILGRLAV